LADDAIPLTKARLRPGGKNPSSPNR
jgi:hypothetical protein